MRKLLFIGDLSFALVFHSCSSPTEINESSMSVSSTGTIFKIENNSNRTLYLFVTERENKMRPLYISKYGKK